MTTITNDANLNPPIASQGIQAIHDQLIADVAKAQEDARTTVIDGSDRVPQFENGMKGPDSRVYSETDRKAISQASQSPNRGRGGKMGKDWE